MKLLQLLRSDQLRLIARYGLVGLLASAFHFTVSFYSETKLGVNPFLSHLYGFFIGLMIAYLGHYFYSFKDSQSHKKRFPKFIVVSLTALILHEFGVYIMVHYFQMNYSSLVLPILILTVPAITFCMSKFWVFSTSK